MSLPQDDREKDKQANCNPLAAIRNRLGELDRFWEREQTKVEVAAFILDEAYRRHPSPRFSIEDKEATESVILKHVWQ